MELPERLAAVRGSIADAAREAGRSVETITTVVVTKFQPVELLRELSALGVRDMGESRHQEASAKAAGLTGLDLRWHFVGQLQSKKAKAAREYTNVVHSFDRESLLGGLARAENASDPGIDVFVQVDLSGQPGRGGVDPGALDALVERVLEARGIRLLGLMTVAPLGEEPRPAFARLRELSERVQKQAPDATFLSMGMSGDYREAVLEGATHLRIGTAITGNRPAHG